MGFILDLVLHVRHSKYHTMKKIPIEDRIRAAIQRFPHYRNSKITANLNNCCSAADVQRIRESMFGSPTLGSPHIPTPASVKTAVDAVIGPAPSTPGIPLKSKRVTSHRPVETAAKYIKRLPLGRGFNPKDLSAEWGMSEETIKKYARDMSCLKWVEVSEDEWVQMVMSPETAAQY